MGRGRSSIRKGLFLRRPLAGPSRDDRPLQEVLFSGPKQQLAGGRGLGRERVSLSLSVGRFWSNEFPMRDDRAAARELKNRRNKRAPSKWEAECGLEEVEEKEA